MRCMIINADGHLGTHLAARLLEQEHEVVSVGSRWVRRPLARGETVYLRDFQYAQSLPAPGPYDVVYDLQGKMGTTVLDNWISTVEPTMNLQSLLSRVEVGSVVTAISSSVYRLGEHSSGVMTESMAECPPTGRGSAMWAREHLSRSVCAERGIPHAVLRVFELVGCRKELWESLESRWVNRGQRLVTSLCAAAVEDDPGAVMVRWGVPPNKLTGIRDYVHVDDAAVAFLMAGEALSEGQPSFVANVGSGEGHSYAEVVEAAKEMRRRLVVLDALATPDDLEPCVADVSMVHKLLGWRPQFHGLGAAMCQEEEGFRELKAAWR